MSNLPEADQRVSDAAPEAAFSALIEKRQSIWTAYSEES
jgi:hypothetical protein